jgi:hypothetical protein
VILCVAFWPTTRSSVYISVCLECVRLSAKNKKPKMDASVPTILICGGVGLVAGILCLFTFQNVFGIELTLSKRHAHAAAAASPDVLAGVQIARTVEPSNPQDVVNDPNQMQHAKLPAWGSESSMQSQPNQQQ